jgi:hypothetical protein
MPRAGCSEAWLSHVLWEHETVGSNPTTPTTFTAPRRSTDQSQVSGFGG